MVYVLKWQSDKHINIVVSRVCNLYFIFARFTCFVDVLDRTPYGLKGWGVVVCVLGKQLFLETPVPRH